MKLKRGGIFLLILSLLLTGCTQGNQEIREADNPFSQMEREWKADFEEDPLQKLDLPKPEKPKQLTEEEKLQDFDFLFSVLEGDYPFFDVYKRKTGKDWRKRYGIYKMEIAATKTDEEFQAKLEEILGELLNWHLHIASAEEVESLLEHYSNYVGYFYVYREFRDLNRQVVRNRYNLPGVQPQYEDFYEEDVEPDMTVENAVCEDALEGEVAMIKIPEMLSPQEWGLDRKKILDYMSERKDYEALILDIRGNPGGLMAYWQEMLLPLLIDRTYTTENYMFIKDSPYSRYFMDGLEDMFDENNEGVVETQTPELDPGELDFARDLRDYDYSILNQTVVAPAADSVHFQGVIYLLVDPFVYSAAEAFAMFFKYAEVGPVVGTTTGGDGATLGLLYQSLPNSGLVFTRTNVLGYDPAGRINEEVKTEPTIWSTTPLETVLDLYR